MRTGGKRSRIHSREKATFTLEAKGDFETYLTDVASIQCLRNGLQLTSLAMKTLLNSDRMSMPSYRIVQSVLSAMVREDTKLNRHMIRITARLRLYNPKPESAKKTTMRSHINTLSEEKPGQTKRLRRK